MYQKHEQNRTTTIHLMDSFFPSSFIFIIFIAIHLLMSFGHHLCVYLCVCMCICNSTESSINSKCKKIYCCNFKLIVCSWIHLFIHFLFIYTRLVYYINNNIFFSSFLCFVVIWFFFSHYFILFFFGCFAFDIMRFVEDLIISRNGFFLPATKQHSKCCVN